METMYFVDRVPGDLQVVEGRSEEADDVLGSVREVVPDALHAAVVRDDPAAVTVDEAEDELLGGLVDEGLLPGLERDSAVVFSAGAVLREEAWPMLGVEPDLDAPRRLLHNGRALAWHD
jgi:hypothetical protein